MHISLNREFKQSKGASSKEAVFLKYWHLTQAGNQIALLRQTLSYNV